MEKLNTKVVALLLPGFAWLTPSSFLLGLAESYIWGLLSGVIFVPIYNYFSDRFEEKITCTT